MGQPGGHVVDVLHVGEVGELHGGGEHRQEQHPHAKVHLAPRHLQLFLNDCQRHAYVLFFPYVPVGAAREPGLVEPDELVVGPGPDAEAVLVCQDPHQVGDQAARYLRTKGQGQIRIKARG